MNANELLIRRFLLTNETSVSELFFLHNGVREPSMLRQCFALEDRFRPLTEPKVPGKTCIPLGRYELTYEPSPKYQGKYMPRFKNVQGPNGEHRFDGVLIHPGNYERDTLGCVLPGMHWSPDDSIDRMKVTESVKAFESIVLPQLKVWWAVGPVFAVVELAPDGLLMDKRRRA